MSVPTKTDPRYTQILKKVEADLGTDATNGLALYNYGQQNIKNFKGVKASDEPITDDGAFVYNLDKSGQSGTHWISVIARKPNVYVYDSFGRDTQKLIPHFVNISKGAGYTNIIDAEYDREQDGLTERNCGPRAISFLLYAQRYGIGKALLI